MTDQECVPVQVSRRIGASAETIFKILADPGRHPELDGSGMLRAGGSNQVVTAIGDVFVMKMYFAEIGDYEMDNHVVAYEPDRAIAWEPVMHGASRTSTDDPRRNGSRWAFELTPDGPDATVVTESYDCSGSPEQVRDAIENGNAWVEAMTATLERLDAVASG
jgi:uncharacterized protein YndB with AHSA1/START domain